MKALSKSQDERVSKFLTLANRYVATVGEEGVEYKVSMFPTELPLFNALSEFEQAATIAKLESDLELFAEVRAHGKSLRDSSQLLWRYLARSRLTPCADIFDKIEDDDVISVYDAQNRQIFQNLKFLELTSVTLEQLFCSAWYHYSQRDPEIEKSLYETAMGILSGQVRETVAPTAPEHIGQEVNTERLIVLSVKVKWASPVFSASQPAAMIVVNRCKKISDTRISP